MRQIASLVLAALLVVGTVPALGAAGVAQHGTDAQYTTDLGDVRIVAGELQTDGAVVADADGGTVTDAAAATNHTDATVTDYRIADRTLAGDEPLRLRMNGSGEGSTPVVLSIDGERTELGTVTADGERVAFESADPPELSIECEVGYDSDDGWYVRCEIDLSFASISDGPHDVGINDLEPTAVTFEDGDFGFANGNLTVTGYGIADRTINPDESLRLTASGTGEGAGETPLSLSVDGERARLGTVSVTEDGARFLPDDDLEAQFVDVEIHCEGGYNSEDGWWFECDIDISFASISDGGHDIGVNDHDPTRVEVDPDEAYLTGVTFRNNTLQPGEVTYANLTVAGDSGSTPVDLTVDGERYRIGTVHVEDGRGEFVADEDAESADAIFPPWPPFPGGPCPYAPPCVPLPLDLAEGGHHVGIAVDVPPSAHDGDTGGEEPTTIAVGDDLEVTGYEFVDAVESANDTDAAVTVFRTNTVRNNTATLAVSGAGVGETPLSLSVDGERTRLGTVRVDAEGARFVPDDDLDAQSVDVDVHCEGGYNSEDGWWFRCEIDISFASLSGGNGDDTVVGVNDLPATTVDVQPAEAQLAGYEIRNTTVRTGGTVQMTTTFEGRSGEVPLVVSVDGREYRAATVAIEDGRIQSVETADAAASPIGFVPCPDLQDDNPLVIVWCATDVPSVAQGTHEVGVNGMAPTTVTVEGGGGPLGGVLGGIGDFVSDLLGSLGGLLSVPAGPE